MYEEIEVRKLQLPEVVDPSWKLELTCFASVLEHFKPLLCPPDNNGIIEHGLENCVDLESLVPDDPADLGKYLTPFNSCSFMCKMRIVKPALENCCEN